MKKIALTTAWVFLWFCGAAKAQVTLPHVFSSHMLLQRDQLIHIWGYAAPGEHVEISLHNAHGSGTADDSGRWSIYLPQEAAGGPYSLSVRGSNTVQLDDVLIGDLWVASGQSNMEIPLDGFPGNATIKDAAKEIGAANYPQIRLLRLEKDSSAFPLDDVKSNPQWEACTPQSVHAFSAVAYFFARDLQAKQHIPIGLIDSTWGGTPAEAWTSLQALSADAGLMPVFASRAEKMSHEAAERRLDALNQQRKAEGKPLLPHQGFHPDPRSWEPAGLYNAMISPLTYLRIRGVIWYQGETNASTDKAPLYSRLFTAMITDWRHQWAEGDFPFLYAQISSYEAPGQEWGLLRDAQRRTLRLASTGMAVTTDVGDPHNVHPGDKQTVGERLSLLARNVVFGEHLTAFGPLFRTAWPQGNSMAVAFDNADGLHVQGALNGFEVAAEDGKFVPAEAHIIGSTVVASAPTIPAPAYVRYDWDGVTPPPLLNRAGLPTSTFSSYPEP